MFWKRPSDFVVILAAFLALPAFAAPGLILAVPEDGSAIDIRPAAEMLIRNGAPATLEVLPTGRINTVMREQSPACRLEVVHDLAKHTDYQWVARTASIDYVAAALTEGARHPPGPQTTAVVALNTVGQAIATKAGYEVLPVKSLVAAVPLLQSGRASVVIAVRQEIDNLAAAKGVPLHVEAVMTHADIWLACNAAAAPEDVQRVGDAWRLGIASGELRGIYEKAGIPGLYPAEP